MSRSRVVCVLLALVTLLIYLPVWHYPFVDYDDDTYVTGNPTVRAGLTGTGIKWALTTMDASNWHPLTWLSLMLDCQLFGLNAGAHHLVNIAFHAANAVLLFALLVRLTGVFWQSAFIAALFAWHPLHVESVAWVAERKDVLSAFFGLLALLAYVAYVQRRSKVEGRGLRADIAVPAPVFRPSTFAYLLALLFFALGLMAKPMLVTLPFVFLLLDYWPLQRMRDFELRLSPWLRLVWEKCPFFVLAGASCVVTFAAQKHGEAVAPLEEYPLSSRLGNAALAYVKYLFKSVYPEDLAVIYPLPQVIPWMPVAVAIVVLAVITGLIWRARRRCPYLLTGWFWYWGMLVPVIGLVQVGSQSMADRYMYLPLIGISIGVAFGVGELAGKLRFQPVAILAAGIVLAGCLFATARQLQYWQNSETLFEHALAVTTDNPVAEDSLGTALGEAGRPREALEHYREALRLEPSNARACNNIGTALFKVGQPQEAITYFQQALRLEPDAAGIHNNLALALVAAGQSQEAILHYQEALRLKPEFPEAHYNLGVALTKAGRWPEAIVQFQKALELEPNNAKACCDLATALLQTGQADEAISYYQKALKIQPEFATACYGLGLAFLNRQRMEEAIAQFRMALQLQPDFTAARNNLGDTLLMFGHILFQEGQMNQAIAPLQEGLQIRPNFVGAYNCLGVIFLKQGRAGEAVADFQRTLAWQPDNVDALKSLAWVWATCPEAALRDGVHALELAQRANQLSGGQDPAALGTLAAAYAEAGRFSEAVGTAHEALQLAGAQTNATAEVVNGLQAQIKCYQTGSPFRDYSLTNLPATLHMSP